ncbi:MAG: DNA-3-methyladenine glycosylase 2 family protein [Ruminococcaceae bacterium]|nr:DNA-3-methyladenine glycosylase 2 family protein [Oscillospiraceae bacterium]
MNIKEYKNSVILKNINHFSPKHTFLCGQCFRWDEESDGSFTGVAFSKVVNISAGENEIIIKNISLSEFESQWKYYLDLDTDYGLIKKEFEKDINVKKAMEFGWGIRILNQEFFECLISFIISTQNTIPRIKKIVSRLSEMYGTKLEFEGKEYYAFPTLEQLKDVSKESLSDLKAGYRSDYIVDAVKKILSGEVRIDGINKLSYEQAKNELMKIKGVGPKVADCVLLFSANKKEAFPIDVWVKRTMQSLYLSETSTVKEIEKFASSHFGKYAGVAQQYLFYYSRENKIGK